MPPSRIVRSVSHWCLSRILDSAGNPPLELQVRDGVCMAPCRMSAVGSVRIADWPTLLKLALDPEYQFGEAYSRGSVTVEGSLVDVLTETYRSSSRLWGSASIAKLRSLLLSCLQANTPGGSRRNIHRHYDLDTRFYRLWLDERLLYTGAYFADSHMSLEEAQVAKMDYVCRKLGLATGDVVFEAGCGWGALAVHMAGRYGVRVRAFNISREQLSHARERARSEGLLDRVEFIEDDYRNIEGKCDAFVSVGMLEHVGPRRYGELAGVIDRCMKENGRALLHFIGRNRPLPLNPWIRRRIFPGAYPPTLRQLLCVLEKHDFSVLDVENLRLHYAMTLQHWLDRFERSSGRIRVMYGPEFERAWRLYLAGSEASFRAGALQLFQVSFARAACNRVPWTRASLYADPVERAPKWTAATF